MSKLVDRVRSTSTTTGTGDYTLAGAVSGYRAFSVVGDGKTCPYVATDGAGGYEVGIGTYRSSGTKLERTFVRYSSNGDAAVNWIAGTRTLWVDATAEYLAISPGTIQGRLTASSTLPVTGNTPNTLVASSNLYYLPFNGNKIALYDGTAWRLHTIPDAGVSLAIGGLTTAQNYDIFIYDNAGTLTLEAVVWSTHAAGTSARATALATVEGVPVKTAANERRYLGTIRTITDTTVKCADWTRQRLIWNVANRVHWKSMETVPDFSRTADGGAIQVWNNGDGAASAEFVVGISQYSALECLGVCRGVEGNSDGQGYMSFGFNTQAGFSGSQCTISQTFDVPVSIAYRYSPDAGYHYISALNSTSNATVDYYAPKVFTSWEA